MGQPQEAVSFWPWFPRPRIYKTSFPWLGALRGDVTGSALSLGKRCLWAVTCSGHWASPVAQQRPLVTWITSPERACRARVQGLVEEQECGSLGGKGCLPHAPSRLWHRGDHARPSAQVTATVRPAASQRVPAEVTQSLGCHSPWLTTTSGGWRKQKPLLSGSGGESESQVGAGPAPSGSPCLSPSSWRLQAMLSA